MLELDRGVDDPTRASMTLGRRIADSVRGTRHVISDGMLTLQTEMKEPLTVDHAGAPALRLGARPFKVNLHAHVRQSTHESPCLFRDHTEGSAVRPGKGRDRTGAGGYKRSLPFTTSRILGVIGSLSSHWSGRLIRVPDKDKDKDKDVSCKSCELRRR